MTREAALLGTPTVSVYAGRRPAADLVLARRGLLRLLGPAEILAGISTRRRIRRPCDAAQAGKRSDRQLLGRGTQLTCSLAYARLPR